MTNPINPINQIIPPAIFKMYDIRGTVPNTLNEEIAYKVGKAFARKTKKAGQNQIAVGRDGRISGEALSNALIKGITSQGVDVINIGMSTTPMLYFAAHTICNSGIQITGSHNPKDDNGFKMLINKNALYGQDIQDLLLDINSDINEEENQNIGKVENKNIYPDYLKRILKDAKLSRPMKIAVDCGNGVAGASAPQILKELGCEVDELYCEVDGNFPNHHPDPSKAKNLQDLIKHLQTSQAEIGLAFDGDGDRLGVVTKDGQIIDADRQLMMFAQNVLKEIKEETLSDEIPNIIFDVKCTQRLAPWIEENGGNPIMHSTGHSLIKAKMKETNAPLGGEMSGHIFFKHRWYGFDDATYAAIRLLEIISRENNPSQYLNSLPTSHNTPEINIKCEEGMAHKKVEKLKEKAAQKEHGAGAKISTIDGLRIDWEDGFGLIRASNTTPVLVLRFEGQTPLALERIEKHMRELLNEVL